MTFLYTIHRHRHGLGIDVEVTAHVEKYAHAIGCPPEQAYRFTGRYEVEIQSIKRLDGRRFSPTEIEYDLLRSKAIESALR